MIVDETDLAWWLELAPSLKWHFSTTMPQWPHSYVVRGKTLGEADFVRAASVVRTYGEPGKFYDRTTVYLTDGDTKWWTMGEALAECQIINKALATEVYGEQNAPHTASMHRSVYDGLATIYDERYTSPAALDENSRMRKLIMGHFPSHAPATLDVGCGTGLLLDLGITAPSMYVGVDPSQGMLNELVRKHPRAVQLHPHPIEEVLGKFTAGQFELVASLFGSASYVHPEVIKKLPSLSRGLTVLMHYRQGYLPDYWAGRVDLSPTIDASREAAAALPGEHFTLNDLEVTVVGG
jgi:hypothetical protein